MSDTISVVETVNTISVSETEIIVDSASSEIKILELGEVVMTNTSDHNYLAHRGQNTHEQIDLHLSDPDIHIINNLIDGGLFQP